MHYSTKPKHFCHPIEAIDPKSSLSSNNVTCSFQEMKTLMLKKEKRRANTRKLK